MEFSRNERCLSSPRGEVRALRPVVGRFLSRHEVEAGGAVSIYIDIANLADTVWAVSSNLVDEVREPS